jgi:hypothetical protein
MADTSHIREYAPLARHREEMQLATRQRRWRMILGVILVAALSAGGYWISPPLGVMLIGIGAMVLFFASMTGGSSVPHHVMAGVEGEVRAGDTLAQLPDDHVIFNQVHIPDPATPYGRRELDFIVVGPDAVTVVEVKNTPGLIHVDPSGKHWRVVKRAGCGSQPGWHSIDNPLMQVGAQTRALERWLLEHGIAIRPRAMVCFARPDAAVAEPERADIPVVTTTELTDQLIEQSQQSGLDSRDRDRIIELLGKMKSGKPARAA